MTRLKFLCVPAILMISACSTLTDRADDLPADVDEATEITAEDKQPAVQPDLDGAAEELGVSSSALEDALGNPPFDLTTAAEKLGIPEDSLRSALGSIPGL